METILQAVKLVDDNKIPQALELLNEYIPKANDDEKFTIAELYLQWGFLEEAEEILSELLRKYPDEGDLKLTLVDIYIEQEKDEKAIAILDEVEEDDPSYIQALVQLADLYQAQGLFEVAEQKLHTAKQLVPNEVIIDFALGELFYSIGEYRKAATHYEHVLKEHETIAEVSVTDRLAETYAGFGEYEKALELFEKGEEQTPDKFFRYGITASQADRNDIAIKAWKRVIEIDPYYHAVYENLTKALIDEGMHEEAYEVVEKGIQQDNFNKQLYFLAGSTARQLNRDEESEEYIRQAIALDPDYLEAILFLLEFLKERNRQAEIIELLTSVKSTGSEDPLLDWELARAYEEEEQYKEALSSYQAAYMNLSDDTDFLKEYGYFLTEEGHIGDAVTVFRQYLQHIPDDYTIEEYLNRLEAEEF